MGSDERGGRGSGVGGDTKKQGVDGNGGVPRL